MKLKIDNGQRTLTITKGGQDVEWSYDVLEVKLMAESMEEAHGLRKPGDQTVQRATPSFLAEFASFLDSLGLKDCTKDAAFHVHQIVNAQFIAMSEALNEQINNELKAAS